MIVKTDAENLNSDNRDDTIYTVNPTYNQFAKSEILVQQEKVKIFYFNSAQSDALLSCFKDKLNKNKSEFRFLPEDEAVFQNDDYTEIFSLKKKMVQTNSEALMILLLINSCFLNI